jgi:type I restriction enzyme, S subunit
VTSPAAWKRYKLGELAQYINGKAFASQDWKPTGLPIIRIQNLTDRNKPFNYCDGPVEDKYRVSNGDLLISWSATLGSFIWDRGPAVLNQHIFRAVPNPALVDRDFLHFVMLEALEEMARHTHGIAMKHITKGKFEAIEVALPSMAEQRRIVARIKACMERVEEIQALRVAGFREREHLAESVIEAELAVLEGDEVAMRDVCEITARLVDPREGQYQSMLHVGGANIESKTGRLIDLKTAKEEKLVSGKFLFDTSVVLYNKIRPYLVKVARPQFAGLCSADMYPLKPKANRATRDFLYYVLASRRFTHYAVAGSNRAGMPKVNRDHLFGYRFTLPKLELQQRASEQLDAAVASIRELEQTMAEADSESAHLRDSILRKAFAGEL